MTRPVGYAERLECREVHAEHDTSRRITGGSKMTIAVTGASGHLGRLAVLRLLETQPAENIIALVRDASMAADLAGRGVQVRVASYDDMPALQKALAGVDRLLLVSGSETGRRVQQHKNVIERVGRHAARAGARVTGSRLRS
jgi:NAD(P)H dehydrogenase (quinone)